MNQYIMQTHHMILNGEQLLASIKFLLIYNSIQSFSRLNYLSNPFFFCNIYIIIIVYQPPSIITIHRLVAQVQRPNIEWPKSYQRYP